MSDPLAETTIWTALRQAVADFAGNTPVAWPAEIYNPETSVAFYDVAFIAAAPRRILIGNGRHVRDGFLTISHVAPIGYTQSWYLQKAAQIVAAFHEGRPLQSCLRITRRAEIMPTYRDSVYMRTPVVIPWQAFK